MCVAPSQNLPPIGCSAPGCTVGDDVVVSQLALPLQAENRSEIGARIAPQAQHDRCDEKEESGAQLSGQRTRDQTTNNSANRSADSNKLEKPFALVWRENISHERPKHCCGEKIEDADPDEKYGRKGSCVPVRLASSA